jgi:hypothetical protein
VFNISKASLKLPSIPQMCQKTPDKRLVIVAAAIAAIFSMNAMAAEIASPADTPSAAGPDATPVKRHRSQQETRKEMLDHWNKMSPKEREQVRNKMKDHSKNMSSEQSEARRKELREHFKNMSPEERRQFQRDMDKTNSMFPPADDLHGSKTDSAANRTR